MRALIADDDAFSRALLTDFLSELGHEVESAEDGAQLVELALSGRPDLIITGLHLPGMTGDSMISMLKRYPDLAGIPVIVITSAASAELCPVEIPSVIPVLQKPANFARIAVEVAKIAGI